MLDASYSYLDFEYTRIDPGATSVDLTDVAPYTPKTKLSFGLQNQFTLSNGRGTLTPRIDATLVDEVFANADNEPTNFIDDYPLVNARLTWQSNDDTWAVALEATNLTNEYYYVTIFDLLGPAGYIHGQPGRPREYAVTLKRSF
jgi:iron complex outermembrane receptor protein